MPVLVLLRHGQSTWNAEQRFTGWVDVGLTDAGVKEARQGGRSLAAAGVDADIVHTSVLARAITTAELALSEAARPWIPVRRHWRLNERHYGALQGATHAEMAAIYGDAQIMVWRRSYDVPPPPLDPDDERHPRFDPRYAGLAPELLPPGESLADVVVRMLPYWYDAIVPDLRLGLVTLVVAHGNSLRALVKHLDGISDEDIPDLEIPTGVPIRYELDDQLRVLEKAQLE